MSANVVTLHRFAGATSGANGVGTADTSTGLGKKWRLSHVTTAYSGSPTQTGVTVTLNSGAGAAFDTVLNTGAANARYTTFIPSSPLYFMEDDEIDVSAPAGGGSLTSSSAIYCEQVW